MIKIKLVYLLLSFTLLSEASFSFTPLEEDKESSVIDTTGMYLFNTIAAIEPIISKYPGEAIDQIKAITPTMIKQNLYRETAYCYMLMGRCYKNLLEPSLALKYMKLAKDQLRKKGISLLLDYEQYQKQDTSTPIKYRSSGLNYCGELLLLKTPIVLYKDWAAIYEQLGEYDKANQIYFILKTKIKNSSVKDEFDYLLANNYYKAKQFEKAILTYKKLRLVEKHKNQNLNIRNCYLRIADCYHQLGKSEKAQENYALANIGVDQTVTDSTFHIINTDGSSENSNTISELYTGKQLSIRNSILNDINLNSLEYLKSSNKYYKRKEYAMAVRALDKYFSKICYALFEDSEIEIIKQVAHHLNNNNEKQKALQYFISYEQLRDTIKDHQLRMNYKSREFGSKGLENSLNAKRLLRDNEVSGNKINVLLEEQKVSNKINLLLALGLILVTIGILYLRHISKQRKIANQQLALRSLRSQMNPHFIFNALNSVNSFISLNDERAANNFLSEFSSLMRSVMENSEYDFISLSKELEIIHIYLQLEHHRFKDKFTFNLDIEEELNEEEFNLPPMLIQPYIENAIWHGLRYKKEMGHLDVTIQNDNGDLRITIKDDGIGREKSKEFKTSNQKKNKSIALQNIKHRIRIFEDLHKIKIIEKIEDLHPEKEDKGTMVTLIIPQI